VPHTRSNVRRNACQAMGQDKPWPWRSPGRSTSVISLVADFPSYSSSSSSRYANPLREDLVVREPLNIHNWKKNKNVSKLKDNCSPQIKKHNYRLLACPCSHSSTCVGGIIAERTNHQSVMNKTKNDYCTTPSRRRPLGLPLGRPALVALAGLAVPRMGQPIFPFWFSFFN
jgi:hypothetical protein